MSSGAPTKGGIGRLRDVLVRAWRITDLPEPVNDSDAATKGYVDGQTGGSTSAADVTVAAGVDGLSAGTAQEAFQALSTRIQAIE